MKHGSLFSGIGGFDLAAEWMRWENLFHCEWNEFGKKILNHYWPNSETFTDITKTNFTKYANKIDVLTGGFPCQPYSSAGKRKGKEDNRHLWPEMLRAIREIQPRWIVGENVRGLINWSNGLVFHEVQIDLENEGYEVTPFLLPACAVNAPHRRDRIWFVANTNSNGLNKCNSKNEVNTNKTREYALCDIEQDDIEYTENNRLQHALENGEMERGRFRQPNKRDVWDAFPSVSPICNGNDGISNKLDGITFSKWRKETLKAGGNAIVPQVAFQIFKTIEQYEKLHH
jgi:DNA (cytosine-5)-methyltransferase 1